MDPGMAPEYSGKFQVGRYLGRSQLTINFIAEDLAGNETRIGKLVSLDSVPPWVSLDPPPVREVYASTSPANPSCSFPFDPVGSESVNDESVLTPPGDGIVQARYRAVVWERGTAIAGNTVVNVSGVKDESVQLFIQSDPSIPLIVDSDDDPQHLCDSVNSKPSGLKAPTVLDYEPILPVGTLDKVTPGANFSSDPAITECTLEPCGAGTCKAQEAADPVPELCTKESDLKLVIKHVITTADVPVIYGLGPAEGNAPGCTGIAWESTITTGWTCVVAAATDKVGNVGISKPLRVCYGTPAQCPESTKPSCTDGCVMPEVFTAQGMPRVLFR
jgi:hypothetical protein